MSESLKQYPYKLPTVIIQPEPRVWRLQQNQDVEKIIDALKKFANVKANKN